MKKWQYQNHKRYTYNRSFEFPNKGIQTNQFPYKSDIFSTITYNKKKYSKHFKWIYHIFIFDFTSNASISHTYVNIENTREKGKSTFVFDSKDPDTCFRLFGKFLFLPLEYTTGYHIGDAGFCPCRSIYWNVSYIYLYKNWCRLNISILNIFVIFPIQKGRNVWACLFLTSHESVGPKENR